MPEDTLGYAINIGLYHILGIMYRFNKRYFHTITIELLYYAAFNNEGIFKVKTIGVN